MYQTPQGETNRRLAAAARRTISNRVPASRATVRRRSLLRSAVLALALGPGLLAARAGRAAEAGATGLPLPRFASLAASRANLRTGPGRRYPVAWVLVRRSMPVEIVGEFGQWRRVRDHEGAEGWVHRVLLSGRRTVLVVGSMRGVHRAPDAAAPLVARAEPGVRGRLLGCRADWCEVRMEHVRGWIPRAHVWGVAGGETAE